jgi:chromosome segregation ATPase
LLSELERYKNEAVRRNDEIEQLKNEGISLRKRISELLEASKIQVEERKRMQGEVEEIKKALEAEHELRVKAESAMKRAVSELNSLKASSEEKDEMKLIIENERARLSEKERELAEQESLLSSRMRDLQREKEILEKEREELKKKSIELKKKEEEMQEFVTETFLLESKGEKRGGASKIDLESKLASAFEDAGKTKKKEKKDEAVSDKAMQEYVSRVIFDYEKKLDSLSQQIERMQRELDEKRRENLKLKSMLQDAVSSSGERNNPGSF